MMETTTGTQEDSSFIIEQEEFLEILDNQDEMLMKIFCNHLIFEKIANCLSFRSLMTLRATSRFMNKSAIDYMPLRHSALLILDDESIDIYKIEEFKTFAQQTAFPWKNISFNTPLVYSLFPQFEESFAKLFANVSCLIFNTNYFPYMKLNNSFTKLLLLAQKFTSVSFGFDLLAQKEDDIGECFTQEIKTHFSTLSSISITGHYDMEEHGEVYKKNLGILLNSSSHLKNLYFDNSYTSPDNSFPLIPQLLEEAKQTQNIEQLRVNGDVLLQKNNLREYSYASITQPHFPSLQHLDFTFRNKLMVQSVNFLKNHPNLTTLHLKVHKIPQVTKPLYKVLKSFSETLEVFSLTWRHKISEVTNYDEEGYFRWTYDFLKNFKRLKVLKIIETCIRTQFVVTPNSSNMITRGHQTSFSSILSCILLDKLDELSLCGFENDETNYPFKNYLSQLNSINLTRLDLLKIKNCLNDSTLHLIYEKLPHLKSLKFSHCAHVTDFGITGIKGGQNIGKSLNTLMGLGEVSIISCQNVSLDAFIKTCVFIDIRVICISIPRDRDHVSIAKMLIKNNSSLEKIIYIYDRSRDEFLNSNMLVRKETLNELKSINNNGFFKSLKIEEPLDYYFENSQDLSSDDGEENALGNIRNIEFGEIMRRFGRNQQLNFNINRNNNNHYNRRALNNRRYEEERDLYYGDDPNEWEGGYDYDNGDEYL